MSIQSMLDRAVGLHEAGHLDGAAELYREILALEPDNPVALNLTAVIELQSGNVTPAIQHLKQALAAAPAYADALTNLGLAYAECGKLDEAVASHQRALAIEPGNAGIHYNLGNALAAGNRHGEAIDRYKDALELEPGATDIRHALAGSMAVAGQLSSAADIYRSSLQHESDNREVRTALAGILQNIGEHAEAAHHYRVLLDTGPRDETARSGLTASLVSLGETGGLGPDSETVRDLATAGPAARLALSRARTRLVPGWHVPMMNDRPRNAAYRAAIERAAPDAGLVLDIGSGSGLLAMMAARAGATAVVSCETKAQIAETARLIVADNRLSDRITVIPKMSSELEVGRELPAKADLLVSEVLSSELISEGVLATIADARRRLLKPDARMIPAGAAIMAALFSGDDIGLNTHVGEVEGFDLSRFNTITARKTGLHRNDLPIELLSDPVAAFEFDFTAEVEHRPATRLLRLKVVQPGHCLGVIVWNRIVLDEQTTFENAPTAKNPASAWNHAIFSWNGPVDIKAGQVVTVTARHDTVIPWFELKEIV